MSVTDDSKSAIDILAEGSISDQLNEPAADEPKVEEPKIDEKEAAREARFEKLEKQLLESQQEAQFMRGYLQRQQAEQTRQPEPKEENEPALDYDALAKDMETRGAKALHEFVDTQIEKRVQKALKEVDGRVNGRINQDRAVDSRRNAFQSELNRTMTEYAEEWKDETFKDEADKKAAEILAIRLGRQPNFPQDMQYFQPGDLYSAATHVAGQRARNKPVGTTTNGSSLREISRRVPATDNLGNGNNGHRNAAPKSINDLGMTDKEKTAANNVYKKLKELNPGMSEEKFVKYYQEGEAARDQ